MDNRSFPDAWRWPGAGAAGRVQVSGDLEYGLLGPLVVRCGGTPLAVSPGKQQAALAALVLSPGRLVSQDELITVLWDQEPPPSARASLHNYVVRLRRALDAGGRQVIVTEPGGYRLDARPDQVDVSRLEAAVTAGRAAARAGDWAQAARTLAAGLALWRGEPLSGLHSPVLAAREVPRLTELRWQAAELQAEADLRLGQHQELTARLRSLVAQEPLRERLHALLMTALARDGQQGAALAAYQAARAVLVRELGAEPGAELQRLHQQILAGETSQPGTGQPGVGQPGTGQPGTGQPGASQPGAGPPPPEVTGVRYSLPPDTAAFTGRTDELARITATAMQETRSGTAVTVQVLDGMPGVGKTALAVRAAHALAGHFPDRQLFIDLNGHTPGRDPVRPRDALAALLAAAGADPRSLPDDVETRAALWRDKMAGQRALLVLDNAASSAQVIPLLPGAGRADGGRCLVLVTSRRHLAGLPGTAAPVPVSALPARQAAEMFTGLAPDHAASPDVAEVVALAGFLPLAISLLARVINRHPAWTLADLVTETRAGLLGMTAEHDSVAAAFDVSYRHLDAGRQRFFRLLSLHPGIGIDEYAAAALAGSTPQEAAALLDDLHREGLVTEIAPRRYGMHDLLRRYARDRAADPRAADPRAADTRAADPGSLGPGDAVPDDADPDGVAPGGADLGGTHLGDRVPGGEDAAARGRLTDYYRRAAAAADARLGYRTRPRRVPGAAPGGPAIPALPDSLRALAWARAERASLVACLDQAARAGQDALVVDLTAGLACLLTREGPWTEGLALHAAAISAARRLGDRLAEADALVDLGDMRRLADDQQGAARSLEQALSIYRDLGNRLGEANALHCLGNKRVTADVPTATRRMEQALRIFRDLGDRLGEANALQELGLARRLTGDFAEAGGIFARSLAIYRNLGNRLGEASALYDVAIVAEQTGDYRAAAATLEQALSISQELGDRRGAANALQALGTVRRATGDYAGATAAHAGALAIYRDFSARLGEANALLGLGIVQRLTGDYAGAASTTQEAMAVYRNSGDRFGEAHAMYNAGAVRRLTGDHPAAARILQECLALCREIGTRGGEAQVLNEQGTLYRQCHDLTMAGQCHQQALDLARAIRSAATEAHALAGLARCAAAATPADPARAATLLRQAHDIFARIGSPEAAAIQAELTPSPSPTPLPT
jgi:DNA-binding SARP family transcriptional activator/tetratricopeptide (TPR) repeat protein